MFGCVCGSILLPYCVACDESCFSIFNPHPPKHFLYVAKWSIIIYLNTQGDDANDWLEVFLTTFTPALPKTQPSPLTNILWSEILHISSSFRPRATPFPGQPYCYLHCCVQSTFIYLFISHPRPVRCLWNSAIRLKANIYKGLFTKLSLTQFRFYSIYRFEAGHLYL